jgi:hypothetical protein
MDEFLKATAAYLGVDADYLLNLAATPTGPTSVSVPAPSKHEKFSRREDGTLDLSGHVTYFQTDEPLETGGERPMRLEACNRTPYLLK